MKVDAFNHWGISFRRSLPALFLEAGAVCRWLVTGGCAEQWCRYELLCSTQIISDEN